MYKAIKPEEIPGKRSVYSDQAAKDIRDFMETSYMAAEIIVPAGQKAKNLHAAYKKQAEKLGAANIRFQMRKGRIFMVKD